MKWVWMRSDLGWASMLAIGQGFDPYDNKRSNMLVVVIMNGPHFFLF